MSRLTAKDGTSICFTDQGSGYPLLFLHGWMMSQKVWHFQLPLASEFRLITLDLRGHGGSNAPEFSYAACLSDVEALLDHLELQSAAIVGWSMGAQLAIKSSAALKKRIAGLMLIGGTPRFCTADDYPYGLPYSEARGMALRLKRDYQGTAGYFFKSMFSAAETASLDLRSIAARTLGSLPPPEISLAALQELIAADLRPLLPEINIPVLLVHGSADSICLPGAAGYMAEQLPLATLERFQLGGHAPFLSAVDRFNAVLDGFVRTVHGRD